MPAVAAAGIAAAAGLGGAAIQSRGAGKAREEAYRANQKAMAYEEKKQKDAKAEMDRRSAAYRAAWNAWAARAGPEGIKRYGVPVGMTYNPTGAPGTGPAGGTPEPTPNPASAAYGMAPGTPGERGMDPNGPSQGGAPYAPFTPGRAATAAASYTTAMGGSAGATPQRAGTLAQLMGQGAPVPTADGMGLQPGSVAAVTPAPLSAQATPPQGGTIGEMAGWNDWNRYGLGA